MGGGSFDSTTGTRCPPPDFLFEQSVELNSCDALDKGPDEEIVCPGTGTFTRGSFKLSIDLTTPLPDDHSFSSGSISRLDDRLVMYVEEFTPSRVGEDTALVGLQKFDPVKTFITRYDFVNTESLGTSNGSAAQTFSVSGSEILLPTTGTPIIFVGGIESGARWSVTDDLSTAEATATVFEYGATTGEVTFGDGINGAIPEDGVEIVLRITIRNGGGQWTFIDIVEAPKDTKNIGGVKSIRDKTFYVQTGIALADAGKMTAVIANLNFVEQSTYFVSVAPANLMSVTRRYNLQYGDDVDAAGGTIVLAFTSGTGFVEEIIPSVSLSLIRLVVDTGVIYPSFKASTPPPATPLLSFPNPVYDPESIDGGVRTSPKIYESTIGIEPIFDVQETQNFRSVQGSNLIDDPFYSIFFAAGEFGGFPIQTDRTLRLIKIGDPSPTATMTRIAPTVDPSEVWTGGTGTFDDPVQTGTFSDVGVGPTSLFGLPSQVIVENGRYSQRIIGSTTRHLDFVALEVECRQTIRDAALATHIQGTSLPNFVCAWTFEGGSITVLPNLT